MRGAVGSTAILLLLLPGCSSNNAPAPVPQNEAELFAPAAMRIHPIFTQVKDWSGDGHPDGIEALIELQDQFGDPTKASGRVVFELFEYRPYDPDPRGVRLVFWNAQLSTLGDQRERWNRTSRTYAFTLAYEPIRDDRSYVLAATFELAEGGRFFDRIILEPRERPVVSPTPATRHPATEP